MRLFIIFLSFTFMFRVGFSQQYKTYVTDVELPLHCLCLGLDGNIYVGANDKLFIQKIRTNDNVKKYSYNEGEVIYLQLIDENAIYAVVDYPGKVEIRKAQNNQVVFEVRKGVLQLAGESLKGSVAIDKNGAFLFIVDNTGGITSYSLKTGAKYKEYFAHHNVTHYIAISPDNNFLSALNESNTVYTWSLQEGLLKSETKKAIENTKDITYSESGKQLLIAGKDSLIYVFDPYSGYKLKTIPTLQKDFNAISISRNDKYMVLGSMNNSVYLYEGDNYLEEYKDYFAEFGDVSFSRDMKYFAYPTNKRGLCIVSTDSINVLMQLDKEITDFADLLRPKGEFETTEQYNARIKEFNNKKSKVKIRLHQEYAQKHKQKMLDSYEYIVLSVDSISRYNADKKEYNIKIEHDENNYAIQMPIEDAKTLKAIWREAKVRAIKRLNEDLMYEHINYEISHKTLSKTYKVGNQINPQDDALLREFLNNNEE